MFMIYNFIYIFKSINANIYVVMQSGFLAIGLIICGIIIYLVYWLIRLANAVSPIISAANPACTNADTMNKSMFSSGIILNSILYAVIGFIGGAFAYTGVFD